MLNTHTHIHTCTYKCKLNTYSTYIIYTSKFLFLLCLWPHNGTCYILKITGLVLGESCGKCWELLQWLSSILVGKLPDSIHSMVPPFVARVAVTCTCMRNCSGAPDHFVLHVCNTSLLLKLQSLQTSLQSLFYGPMHQG